VPPQQRQRHRDQPGAQDAEQHHHGVDRVGDLEADDLVGLQPHVAQPFGHRRDRPLGLCISQAARGAVGDALAVGRVDQRDGVGPACGGAAKQVIEGRARALGEHRGVLGRGLSEDHAEPHCA
jgi:hypothetical protein